MKIIDIKIGKWTNQNNTKTIKICFDKKDDDEWKNKRNAKTNLNQTFHYLCKIRNKIFDVLKNLLLLIFFSLKLYYHFP